MHVIVLKVTSMWWEGRRRTMGRPSLDNALDWEVCGKCIQNHM